MFANASAASPPAVYFANIFPNHPAAGGLWSISLLA